MYAVNARGGKAALIALCAAWILGCAERVGGSELSSYPLIPVDGRSERKLDPVEPGTKVVGSVDLLNRTTKTLKPGRIKRSCSCSDATIDKELVLPDEECTLTFTIDTNSLQGPFTTSVFIYSAAPEEALLSVIALTVQVDQMPGVRVSPEVVELGRWSSVQSFESGVAMEFATGLTPSPPQVVFDPEIGVENLQVVASPVILSRSPDSWLLPLRFQASGPPPTGTRSRILTLRGSIGSRSFRVPLKVSWESSACVRVGSESIFIGRILPGEWVQRSVNVFFDGCGPLDVLVEPDCLSTRAEFVANSDGGYALALSIRADPGHAGLLTRRVACLGKHSGEKLLELTIRGLQ